MEEHKYSKFEIARLVGARALQISMGAPFLIKLDENDLKSISYNPVRIAQRELEQGVIPITVVRPAAHHEA
ncbi:MAG: DNA-directed RNA polymerase subunit K [Nanoarchaeota archaeon]